MGALKEINGIGEGSLKLLDAAGIRDAQQLAAKDPDELVAELQRASDVLKLTKRAPGKAAVEKWIAGAMKLGGDDPPKSKPAVSTAANFEGNPEVAAMLLQAPCAIPLPGRIMMEKGLAVSDIPAGLLLNRYSGDLDVRVDDPSLPKTEVPTPRWAGNLETIEKGTTRRHFDIASAKPMTATMSSGKRIPRSKQGHEQDRVALIRAPREKTNRGKNPESRNYIRGVLHTHPWSLRFGAIFSLLLVVNLPLAIITAFLLLLSRETTGNFEWVPGWFLAFPIALPLVSLGYLFWGVSGKCRICAQKLFMPKGALKHTKAHRLPGMGYVVPLALHLLLFSWFRCSSCGTPVRLKK